MKKVAYNVCFGGFNISKECAEWLALRGNKECMGLLADREDDFYGGIHETVRHDALLVMAIEHLGSEVASGNCAELAIYELKGDRYYIDEYDGSESVVEPHTINWTKV